MAILATLGAGAADLQERVVLTAEEQSGNAERWHGEGEVRVLYQDIEIRCDELLLRRYQDLHRRRTLVVPQRRMPLSLEHDDLVGTTGVWNGAGGRDG